MADLTRQSSRERFMLDFLMNRVGLSASVAEGYVPGLVEQGYDTEPILLTLTPEELRDDFEWKKGHIMKFEMFRAKQSPSSPQDGASASTSEGTPMGPQLPDGSTLTLTDSIVGRGANGIVRLATLTRRSGTTEQVAAKTLAAGATERDVQKFAKEYDVSFAAAQQCSGVCRIYGCVSVDATLCLVMKLYAGDLAQRLDARRDAAGARIALPLRDAHTYLLQIAQSLVELHAMGICVQDLKPSNLLEDDAGRLVVADFGIALLADATLTSTASQSAGGAGTVYYMAPEQHDSEEFGKVTTQADIWAWGCIAVEMLSGAAPWSGMRALEILGRVVNKKQTPQVPSGLPAWLSALLRQSFLHVATDRPTAAEVVKQLAAHLDDLGELELIPDRGMSLVPRAAGTSVYINADALLRSSWTKRDTYDFLQLVEVQEVNNSALERRYEQYKQRIAPGGAADANEQLVFHGCAEAAIASISEQGFLKTFWKTAAGDWQRFGPGFYFALQAHKSHEYPLGPMRALEVGEHSRTMLLCKVAKGTVFQTHDNLDMLTGSAPTGYHSVHGIATDDGPLNYDELVVFDEEAVLPYAVVTYQFAKKQREQHQESGGGVAEEQQREQEPEPAPEDVAATTSALAKVRALGFPQAAASAALTASCGDVQQAIDSLLDAQQQHAWLQQQRSPGGGEAEPVSELEPEPEPEPLLDPLDTMSPVPVKDPHSSPAQSRDRSLVILDWAKLTLPQIQGSVWTEIGQDADLLKSMEDGGAFRDLESLFTRRLPTRRLPTRTHSPLTPSKTVALLDAKRSISVQIFLSNFRISFVDIKIAILEMNEDILDADTVEMMIPICPDMHEMEQILGYEGELQRLGKSEQYFREVGAIPRLRTRLECLHYKLNYKAAVDSLSYSLANLDVAICCVLESEAFKKVLEILLHVGNFVNQESPFGNARGVQIDFLAELKPRVWEILVSFLNTDGAPPGVHAWASELQPALSDLRGCDDVIAGVEHQLSHLSRMLDGTVRPEIEAFECAGVTSYTLADGEEIDDDFGIVMKEFIAAGVEKDILAPATAVLAGKETGQLWIDLEQVKSQREQLLTFFGEPSSAKVLDFEPEPEPEFEPLPAPEFEEKGRARQLETSQEQTAHENELALLQAELSSAAQDVAVVSQVVAQLKTMLKAHDMNVPADLTQCKPPDRLAMAKERLADVEAQVAVNQKFITDQHKQIVELSAKAASHLRLAPQPHSPGSPAAQESYPLSLEPSEAEGSETAVDVQKIVVVHVGSDITKAGYAGDYAPSATFSSIIGKSGPDMKKTWHHIFYELRTLPSDYHLLVVDDFPTDHERGKGIAQMFEMLDVAKIALIPSALAVLRDVGRDTAVVLDVGATATVATPVVEGMIVSGATQRVALGGRDVRDTLLRIFHINRKWFSDDVADHIVQAFSYVAADFDVAMQNFDVRKNTVYEKSDGELVHLGAELFRCVEPLFARSSTTLNAHRSTASHDDVLLAAEGRQDCVQSLPELVFDAIMKCPADDRATLCSNVIVVGKTTQCKGFAERMQTELKSLVDERLPGSNHACRVHAQTCTQSHTHPIHEWWEARQGFSTQDLCSGFCGWRGAAAASDMRYYTEAEWHQVMQSIGDGLLAQDVVKAISVACRDFQSAAADVARMEQREARSAARSRLRLERQKQYAARIARIAAATKIAAARRGQLARMRVEGMKATRINVSATNPVAARANPRWVRSTECTGCMICQRPFGVMSPKHHCRRCGWAVCGHCSADKLVLDQWLEEKKPHALQKTTSSEPLRVCTNCHGAAIAAS